MLGEAVKKKKKRKVLITSWGKEVFRKRKGRIISGMVPFSSSVTVALKGEETVVLSCGLLHLPLWDPEGASDRLPHWDLPENSPLSS